MREATPIIEPGRTMLLTLVRLYSTERYKGIDEATPVEIKWMSVREVASS